MADLPISGLTTLGSQSSNDLFVVVELASGVTKKETRGNIVAPVITYADGKVSDTVYGVGWNGATTIAPSKNAVYDKIESVVTLLGDYLKTDGSNDMEADINFANDGTGITWVGGSSVKETSGILSIISYDELRLNSGAASVFIDGADIVIDDLFGLVWDGGNVYIKKDNTDLLIQNSLALGNIFIDSGTGGEIALGGDLIRLASTNVRFSNLTASTVVYLDASKNLVSSAITPTQLGYLSPATGNTGTGSLVFGTSPAITTSLTTGSTTFALVNTTATTVNFAGGASVALNIGNASGTNTISGATTFSQALIGSTSLTIASDTDATTILGRCRVHSNVSDRMLISHFDLSSSTNFVIEQLSTGASKFNAGSGQSASISVNRTDKVMVSATETKIVSGNNFWLGNAAVTGLSAGALAATTNASIVIYDSAGQAYRIPCII
jgi:hypothetical protein